MLGGLFLLFTPADLRASPPDLPAIQASLDSLRERAAYTQLRLREKVRWLKGFLSEGMEPPRLRGSGEDIPDRDVVLEAQRDLFLDFRRGRRWGKGSSCDWTVAKDSGGNDRFVGCLTHFESAFDGAETGILTPKNLMDTATLPRDGTLPKEFQRRRLVDGGKNGAVDFSHYPIYLMHGCLPAPDQKITAEQLLPPFQSRKWAIAGVVRKDNLELPILVSVPDSTSFTHEYTLRPDLAYLPCRFVRYYEGKPCRVVDIEYDMAESDNPQLKGWNVKEYFKPGVLDAELQYDVVLLSHPTSVADSQFRVSPPDGIIAVDWNGPYFYITGDESIRFRTLAEANEVLAQRVSRWPWMIVGCIALLSIVLGGYALLRRARNRLLSR